MQAVDRVLKDGEQVRLGGTVLTAHLTPGHTRGCTTWTADVPEGARTYNVIIACGGLQEDARLVGNKNYPEIAEHFAQTIKKYQTFKPDVFLASHAWFYDPAGKYARLQKGETPNPYIDPAGYRAWVANMEKNWNSLMAEQSKNPPAN
jgi:metallo-beta-lactamase class B